MRSARKSKRREEEGVGAEAEEEEKVEVHNEGAHESLATQGAPRIEGRQPTKRSR